MNERTSRHHKPSPARTAVVVGGGISALVAARDLAAAGFRVTVLEASASFGGCVGVHEVAGLRLDSGAESFATRSTAVADLATELGLAEKIVSPNPAGAWVRLPSGPVPLPKTGVLGIPADPWAPEVRAALGLAGSLRASLDARLPARVGTTAEVSSVAELVRARMGQKVLDTLVAPVVGGVHSADPELLDVDMVAPGLRAGIREHGSLAAAVAAQRAAAPAGSAVGSLAGGMNVLVAALTGDLRKAGVELHAGRAVTGISRTAGGAPDGGASGEAPDGTSGNATGGTPGHGGGAARWTVAAGDWTAPADLLVVATDGPAAVGLLAPAVPALAAFAPAPGPDVRLVTLVVDLPELDTAPRGTGILVAPQTPGIRAKALTHATAKWHWLADEAGPGTHVLRLSYGRAAADAVRAAEAEPTDAALLEAALADATELLGQKISAEDVLGADVVRWRGALPFAAVGHRARITELRTLAAKEPGLLLLGGWLAGNGLAAVVADARARVKAATATGTGM
ncbi:protoporphyrinogen/coproporphyrinogen oxidase [Pseudarthrobacter sp. P1]|uniref:protoporphyrinogen/coproporphyrinogen oxidase n=1 Tax=Pseudarthrobacter sp. P1 TaxID=3418418 RepID=UPI003CE7CB40